MSRKWPLWIEKMLVLSILFYGGGRAYLAGLCECGQRAERRPSDVLSHLPVIAAHGFPELKIYL